MKKMLGLGLVLAAALTACGAPGVESPVPQGSEAPTSLASEAPAPLPSAPAATAAPSAVPGGVAVWTDDSQLEPRPTPLPEVYERWHGEFTDHLIPSKDYGPLLPFAGAALSDPWVFYDWYENFYSYTLEGLMTLEGKVVVDPVYASIVRLCSPYDWDVSSPDTYYPAYLLATRYVGNGENLFGGHGDMRAVLCAADGSWVTEREYRFSYDLLCYGIIRGAPFALRDGNVLVMLDLATGREAFSVPLPEDLTDEDIGRLLNTAAYHEGIVTAGIPKYSNGHLVSYTCYLWDGSGNPLPLAEDITQLDSFSEGLCAAQQSGSRLWGYINTDGQWAIPPRFTNCPPPFEDGVAMAGDYARQLIDRTGRVLYQAPVYDHCCREGDYWYFSGYSGDVGLVLDRQGNEVPSPLLHGGYVHDLDYGWMVMDNADGSQLLARGTESWSVPWMWDDLWRWEVTEDTVFLSYSGEYAPGDSRPRWYPWRPGSEQAPDLYDPRVRLGSFQGSFTDPVTGTPYYRVYNDDGTYSLFTSDHIPLLENVPGTVSIFGGLIYIRSEASGGRRAVTLRSPEGTVLFRHSFDTRWD